MRGLPPMGNGLFNPPEGGNAFSAIEYNVDVSCREPERAGKEPPKNMPARGHFDLLAPLYEAVIRPADPSELCSRIGLPVPGALLDAGGGTGRVAQFLRGQAGSIVVADLSAAMLAETRRKKGLSPVCSPTEKLPFADQTFERIIMVDAFHHVGDQIRTAGELWRVLRPGGRLVIEEPDIRSFAVKLIAAGEKLALMRSRFLPPPRIAAMFRHPGARISIAAENATAWITVEKVRTSENG
jgi:SAM-dependent methyltransferase